MSTDRRTVEELRRFGRIARKLPDKVGKNELCTTSTRGVRHRTEILRFPALTASQGVRRMSNSFGRPPPAPDRIPDEIVAAHQDEARRRLRKKRSTMRRLTRRIWHVLGDGEVWVEAVATFLWALIAVGFSGGVAYGLYLWPAAALYVLPFVALFGLSLGFAAWRSSRGYPKRR